MIVADHEGHPVQAAGLQAQQVVLPVVSVKFSKMG
jgi:hypothetical protein